MARLSLRLLCFGIYIRSSATRFAEQCSSRPRSQCANGGPSHKYRAQTDSLPPLSSPNMSEDTARGSIAILQGNILSTGISAVAAILIIRLLGPDSYGVYTAVFFIPAIFQLFSGVGITSAVTRYTALHLSKGEADDAALVAHSSMAFVVIVGLCLASAGYFLAPFLSQALLSRGSLTKYVQIASLFILAETVSNCSVSTLVGWGSMRSVGLLYISQAVAKLAIAPALIFLGFGIYGAVIGQVASYAAEGLLGVSCVYLKKVRGHPNLWRRVFQEIKTMLPYGLPIYLGGLVSGAASRYLTIVLALAASNILIGYYGAALNFVGALSIISASFTTVLFRSFTTLDGLGADLGRAFNYGVRYVSYVLTPFLFFLLGAAEPLILVVLTASYEQATPVLQLFAIAYLPLLFGQAVIAPFFNGTGKSRFTLFSSVINAIALVAALQVFVAGMGLGVYGVVYSLGVSGVAETIFGLAVSIKRLGARLSFGSLAGIILSGCISTGLMSLIPPIAHIALLNLVFDASVFAFVYLSAVPLLRGLDLGDIGRLHASISRSGAIGAPLRMILAYERSLLRLVSTA